jgi:hypothetical protein
MCGVFGIIARNKNYSKKELFNILEKLAKLSQVRGKDTSGFAYRFGIDETVKVLKGPFSINNLLKSLDYKKLKEEIINKSGSDEVFTAFGHARLVTNGTQLEDNNNQPVIKDNFIGVHNGIIANVDELWEKHPDLKRAYEIDTEFLFAYMRELLQQETKQKKLSHAQACFKVNSEVFGTLSTAFFDADNDVFILFSNCGSLYVLTDYDSILIFGSESNILKQVINKFTFLRYQRYSLRQIKPLSGIAINLSNFLIKKFDSHSQLNVNFIQQERKPFDIYVKNITPKTKQLHAVIDPKIFLNIAIAKKERELLEYNIDKISKLRRCTKCILPETFPFIEFDEKGVCNYCRNYKLKNQPKPISELEKLVYPYRRKKGEVDCLIPYSGGRDSTFTLHFVKKTLCLNPIAFTYDWGMVTDLARRNIARVTGKLGVENVIVAADIHWKRKNINKNISAWLKHPNLGMVPLFMAGDKYFYYYSHQIKKQNNIKLNIWGINPLENTDFKTGFAGIPPNFDKERIFSLRFSDHLKLFSFVGKNVLINPGYINQSIIDTIGSIFSRYLNPKRDYYHLFDYYKWDESEIEDLIKNEYEWELAVDTKTTWRIGDGTASFYNYIYYTVAGFSEYDTFRSNQIREGALIRENALLKINEENKPRYETIKWYLEIIGLNYESVIKRINQIPKLY